MTNFKCRVWNGERMLFMGKGGYSDFRLIGGEVYVCDTFEFHKKDYPLMLWTGWDDYNNEEIYAGDIVIDHVGKGVVEYVEKYAGFRVNYKDGTAKWFYDYTLKGERESIEVVGNIYKNPDIK